MTTASKRLFAGFDLDVFRRADDHESRCAHLVLRIAMRIRIGDERIFIGALDDGPA